MDGDDTIQSFDESEIQTEEGFYKTLFRLFWKTRKISLPVVVTKAQEDDGMITVQPLVDYDKVTRGGHESIQRPEVKVWPVQFRHGGFKIQAPIFVGDTGYVISGDRECQKAVNENCHVLQKNYEKYEDSPNNKRQKLEVFDMNQWEYGFFIPASWEKPVPDDENAEKLFIGNVMDKDDDEDKSAYMTMDLEGNISFHGAEFEVDAPAYFREKIYQQKDDDDPDAAETRDTILVIADPENENRLLLWKGLVFRSEGEIIGEFGVGATGQFHFGIKIEHEDESSMAEITIGDGAVQIGGYTYFTDSERSTEINGDGEHIIAMKVGLGDRSFEIVDVPDMDSLNNMQDDMNFYIFPLYKIEDFKVVRDYRPMPNAGCWEIGRITL